MPHKCTKCGRIYKDGDEALLRGCKCGNRRFYYLRKVPRKKEKKNDDLSNIKVILDGVYEIDVDSLMKNKPVIVSKEEGRYLVSIASIFKNLKNKRKD